MMEIFLFIILIILVFIVWKNISSSINKKNKNNKYKIEKKYDFLPIYDAQSEVRILFPNIECALPTNYSNSLLYREALDKLISDRINEFNALKDRHILIKESKAYVVTENCMCFDFSRHSTWMKMFMFEFSDSECEKIRNFTDGTVVNVSGIISKVRATHENFSATENYGSSDYIAYSINVSDCKFC